MRKTGEMLFSHFIARSAIPMSASQGVFAKSQTGGLLNHDSKQVDKHICWCNYCLFDASLLFYFIKVSRFQEGK